MMSGFLKANDINIQRHRGRSSVARVDPTSVAERFGNTAKRRTYSVASPNSLWHIDGHMNLIRWGMATHGAIDGYSRLIPYLRCSTNNKATTVLRQFVPAVQQYGIPARVRADHGKENLLVGLFMNLANGPDSKSVSTGRSVHNQRIERLWRDVYQQVVDYFHKLFYEMEDEEILVLNSTMDVFALQFVFVPIINSQLEHFRLAWNKHKLRTESNRTPEELWLDGVLNQLHSPSLAITNMFEATPLDETLNDALHHFHLSAEDFPDIEEENSILNPEQARELNNIISQKDDYKMKFSACFSALEIMVVSHTIQPFEHVE